MRVILFNQPPLAGPQLRHVILRGHGRAGTTAASRCTFGRVALSPKGLNVKLRCYAYRSGRAWEAVCVDFDIATFGDALDEVKASLATCIYMHLAEIEALPVADRRHLLKRRSPWYVRAKLSLVTWLRGNARRVFRFTLRSQGPSHP